MDDQWHASLGLTLPGWLTLDTVPALVEHVRETAGAFLKDSHLTIQWSAANEWDLRGAVEETLASIGANFGIETSGLVLAVTRWQGEARPFA